MTAAAERWHTFLSKVRTRLQEVVTEADAGLDELVATEVLDSGPVSAALNEVKARLWALREKIEVSWRTLSSDMVEAEHELEEQGRSLAQQILTEVEALETRTRQKVRTRLKELSSQERATRVLQCSGCRGPLPEPKVVHRVENVTCAHCGAVNTIRPGMATALLAVLR